MRTCTGLVDSLIKRDTSTPETRKRRRFTPEYKSETVRVVLDAPKPLASVGRDLGLRESVLTR